MFFYTAKTSTALSFHHQIELSLSSPNPSNFSVVSPCILAHFPALASFTSLSRFRSRRRHILLHHSSMQRLIHSINPAIISLPSHPKQPDRYFPMHLMHNQSKPLL
jgi:hypothetical protein